MDNEINNTDNPQNGKSIAGVILLAVGLVLLLEHVFDFDIALWPLWLIGAGLYIGVRSKFKKSASFFLILLGSAFLLTQNIPHGDKVFFPIVIIGFGVWLILRRNKNFNKTDFKNSYSNKWDWRNYTDPVTNEPSVDYTSTTIPPNGPGFTKYPPTGDNVLDAVSVFGGVKKTILSKDFKGGEIVNVFGGAELDFTQAEINGTVVIDITQLFGGTKIIVPSHWRVVADLAAVFAGVDDKRIKNTAGPDSDKILVLKGVSIFAGIDIRSY